MPSIGHFILQQSAAPNGTLLSDANAGSRGLSERRQIPQSLLDSRPLLAQPPLFRLAGLAIGNGLTDPATQVLKLTGGQTAQGVHAASALALLRKFVAPACCSSPPWAARGPADNVHVRAASLHGLPWWAQPPPPHRSPRSQPPPLPSLQVMSHADVAYFGGLIDPRQRLRAMTMQLETVQLISAGKALLLLLAVMGWALHPANCHQHACIQLET